MVSKLPHTFLQLQPGDSVDSVLEMLVANCVSGLPVVDENNKVVSGCLSGPLTAWMIA